MSDGHQRILTHVVDTVSAGAILGTFVGVLPPLAAFVAIIWYVIQIYESRTVQKHVRARHIAYLRHKDRQKHRHISPPHFPGAPE